MNKTQNKAQSEAKDIIKNAQIEAQNIVNLAIKKAKQILNENSILDEMRAHAELIEEQTRKNCLKIREENSLIHSIYTYKETQPLDCTKYGK